MADSMSAPVSAVIPCYRCSDTVVRALASVFAQTWRPAEVLLVDDHSGDETLSRLRALEAEYPAGWIQVLSLPENGGPGTARNAGWERACQPYVAFLDADDSWHRQKIEIQLRWMLSHPEAALTAHGSQVAGELEGNIATQVIADSAAFNRIRWLEILLSNRFPTRSVILKRNLPYRFVPGKRHSEDYLLWCEICLDGYACYQSTLPLAFSFKAEYGEAGLSGNLWLMEKGELDCYARLNQSGRISLMALTALHGLSLTKYLKRLAKVGMKSIGGW